MNINDEKRQIVPIVKFLLPTLTKTERKSAEYLLNHPQEVAGLTLADFAQRSNSSEATVMRLCKKIGVGGYAQMKSQLAMQLALNHTNGSGSVIEVPGSSSIASIVKRVFDINIQTLIETMALYSDEYDKAFKAVLHAKQISFFAIGDAMHPCEMAAFKFRKLGYVCYADPDQDLQVINANNLCKGDVAIVVSHTGKTRQAVSAARIAKKRGAAVICITKRDKSPLLQHCDVKLYTAVSDMRIGQEIAARRVAETAILEALFLGVLEFGAPSSLERIEEISLDMKDHKLK